MTVHSTCVYCTRVHAHHQTSDNEEAEIHDLRSAARSSRASSSSSSRSSTVSSPRGVDTNDERERLTRPPRRRQRMRVHGRLTVMYPVGRTDGRRAASKQEEASPDFTNRCRKHWTSMKEQPTACTALPQSNTSHSCGNVPRLQVGLYILPGNLRAGNWGRQRRFSDWNEQDL